MKSPSFPGLLLLAVIAASCAAAPCSLAATSATTSGWQAFTPAADSTKILRNHIQGLAYEIEELLPASHLPSWVRESCSTIYWRLDWAEVTDADGRPKFAQLDREIFAGYRALGFKLAFRIMVNNQSTDARYVTPRAVIERYRIPTVVLPSRRAGEQVCTVFWSPEFLAAHEELMREFGAWFDGQPWAAQAELGTIGEWGEMHLGRWGAASLAAHGWGPTTFFRTVTAFMEQMERHLPRTTKAFCWAPIFNIDPDPAYAHLLRHALERGWWLRSDGLDAGGPPPMVRLAYNLHRARLGLIGEGSLRQGATADDLAAWFQRNVDGGVAQLNPMGTKRLCARHPEVARKYAAQLGPRLTIARTLARLAAPLHGRPPRLLLDVTMRQAGNVPHFRPALLRVQLRTGESGWFERELIPAQPFAALLPGQASHERVVCELPGAPPAGAPLTLHLALVDPAHGPLDLPHSAQAPDGWLPVGELSPTLTAAADCVKLAFDFQRDRVEPAEGVTLAKTDLGVRFHGDKRGLAYFVRAAAPLPTRPVALYLVHSRYRATSIAPVHGSLLSWLDGRGANGELTTFVALPAYDGRGAWQEGTITHRPRANDRTLRVLFLGKGADKAEVEIAQWCVEEISFPPVP